ncbi:hypothetical protein EKO04_011054 [Ascochyta lentis]|uniref:Uncharacterized protein n=1 Tax=Ascochyta lentis TaxID=205686 RepID=A0A8H7MF97_9PLEO|nr:hypothetical protein EKO04_011054 [Ascochyta lentis]
MQTSLEYQGPTDASDIPLPTTPITPITPVTATGPPLTPQAPKKAKAKILEYLKPTVYKPYDNPTPKAPKEVLDALSRAAVRKPSSVRRNKAEKKTYPIPRKLLISIVDGKTDFVVHKYVPVRYLMQISDKAAEVLEPKPWAGKFKIYGKYDHSALRSVVDAIVRREDIPVLTDDESSSLEANLLTYEACLRVGISSTHGSVKALLKTVYSQLSKSAITPDILHLVTYRLGPEDAVFRHTANVLCYQRFTKNIPNVLSFEEMVAKKPALQKAMVQIDQAHKARREAINASKRDSTHKNGEAGDEARVSALNEMVESAVATARVRKDDVAEEQKDALLALLKAEKADEKDGNGGGEVKKVEKAE